MNNKKVYDRDFFSQNILTKVTYKIKKYNIASFDAETHGYMNKVLIIGVMSDEKTQRKEHKDLYKSFIDKHDAQVYIEKIVKKDIYIMATNLMFDYQALYYDTRAWNEFKIIMRNGSMITAKRGKIVYSDTINYTHSSVLALGKQIGLRKLGYEKMMGKVPRTRNQWRNLKLYNARDCLITKRWTETFQDILNKLGGELKLTIASCAMDLYRRKFIPFNIYKEHFECKKFIYESYYGGRVEAFGRGKLPIKKGECYYWMDYNSAYPYQMTKEYPLPSSARMTKQTSEKLIKNYHGCSKITIEVPYSRYPLLPYRQDGKLLFPYGTMTGTWNHIEINRAIELGCKIKKIYKTLYYTKTFYPFKKYVETLYKLRLKYKSEGNLIMSEICKLLMNSLYGKFATKNMQDIEFYDFEQMTDEQIRKDDIKGRFDGMKVTAVKGKKIKKGYSEHEKDCNQNYILPILSSCVTAYQRVDLHKDLVRLDGLYCDTDSILTKIKMIDNYELGGLKLEKEVTKGWIIRPKCYMIHDKKKGWNIKAKGLKGIKLEHFIDILAGKPIKQFKFMKIKEAITRRYAPNQRISFRKMQNLEDNKREWRKSFNKDELQDSEPKNINT